MSRKKNGSPPEILYALLREAEQQETPKAVVDPLNGRKHLSAQLVINALILTKGSVYAAADMLGTSTVAIYKYTTRNPTVRQFKSDIDGLMIDKAEMKLHEAVDSGQPWAVKFLLATKGKSRGYTQTLEHTGPGGGPIQTSLMPDLSQMTDEDMRKFASRFLEAAASLFKSQVREFVKQPLLEDPDLIDLDDDDEK